MTRATEYTLMKRKEEEVREHYSALVEEYLKKEEKNYRDTYFNWNAKKLTLRWNGRLRVKDLEFLIKMFGEIEYMYSEHKDIVIVFGDDA